MAMERYNMPVVKQYVDKVFWLGERYLFANNQVADLLRPKENVPAGVVDDSVTSDECIVSVRELIDGLEADLVSFEKFVPEDLTSQRDIADLLSDVRCYIDSKEKGKIIF